MKYVIATVLLLLQSCANLESSRVDSDEPRHNENLERIK